MSQYTAPLKDISFVLKHVVGLSDIAKLPGCEDVTDDLVDAIFSEAGKFSSEVLAPLNRSGDQEGAKISNGNVTTPKGFKDAYWKYVEGGWSGLEAPVEFGGQGLPHVVATPVSEMLGSANMAFKLCPLLTLGAIEALDQHASQELKDKFLPNMTTGKWTGTMNLTEPQAGSDLALVRTKAVPVGDGSYKITGQKIFITYGDHDYTENIIHLVLARVEGAPEGVKGISLFLVPKVLVNADGSLGERNDVKCASIEHKLGIHASPTCVMIYGEDEKRGGAIGYPIGEINRGLEYMFVIVVFVVNGTFRTIPTVESYGAGVFVPTRTDLAVKLKSFYPKLACTIPTGFKFCEVLLPLVTDSVAHNTILLCNTFFESNNFPNTPQGALHLLYSPSHY